MLEIIIDFIEQNWSSFIFHCQQHGINNEKEIEEKIEEIKKQLYGN